MRLTGGGDASGGIVWPSGSFEAAVGLWYPSGEGGGEHRKRGVATHFNCGVTGFRFGDNRVSAVEADDGTVMP